MNKSKVFCLEVALQYRVVVFFIKKKKNEKSYYYSFFSNI